MKSIESHSDPEQNGNITAKNVIENASKNRLRVRACNSILDNNAAIDDKLFLLNPQQRISSAPQDTMNNRSIEASEHHAEQERRRCRIDVSTNDNDTKNESILSSSSFSSPSSLQSIGRTQYLHHSNFVFSFGFFGDPLAACNFTVFYLFFCSLEPYVIVSN